MNATPFETPFIALSSWEMRERKDRELAAVIAARPADSLIGRKLSDYPEDEREARAAMAMAAWDRAVAAPPASLSAGIATHYRTTFLDYDARHDPKTDHSCVKCQRDLKPGQPFREVHIIGGGTHVLHPEDEAQHAAAFPNGDPGDLCFYPIGNDCARKLGLEWTWPPRAKAVL